MRSGIPAQPPNAAPAANHRMPLWIATAPRHLGVSQRPLALATVDLRAKRARSALTLDVLGSIVLPQPADNRLVLLVERYQPRSTLHQDLTLCSRSPVCPSDSRLMLLLPENLDSFCCQL